MNAPDRFELFVIPDGESKIQMEKDTRVPNSASFTFLKEDHTLANMLRMQLLKNPKVLFAGYKVPHPLEHSFVLKIQTIPDTTPLECLRNDITLLIAEITGIKKKFENELTLHGVHNSAMNDHIMNVSNVDTNF
ncbi:DNA-directed RNA polymerase II core subunit [Lobulomyces angularis]|nr:DNA-directed RNA polymerase II core subunit [Lobulomyces angularis]